MAYEPFIDDPEHICAVDRQRFVVLRPSTVIREVHNHLQAFLRERAADLPISYPAQPHVTLAGFGAGTPLGAVQDLVQSWSQGVSPLRITIECLACFPAPAQVVIIRASKTPELLGALKRLRLEASRRQLPLDTTISAKHWIFHMSVAYCAKLSGLAWNEVTKFAAELEIQQEWCVVNEVEVAAFDDRREYSGGVYALHTGAAESIE